MPIEEGVTNHLVKTLSVTVYDIPSQDHPGQTIGSVSYADSFLESTVRIQKPDERIDLDGKSLLLTGHVPRILSWPVREYLFATLPVILPLFFYSPHDSGARR